MADASLDDFFAKKDKKKKGGKIKSSTNVPEIDTSGPGTGGGMLKEKKKKKVHSKSDNQNVASTGLGGDERRDEVYPPVDEEWIDYVEEKSIDLSGLRIQNLQIASKREDDEDKEDQENETGSEDGERQERKDGSSGPWNKAGIPPPAQPAPLPEPLPEPPKPEEHKPSGKYVPPGLRNQASGLSSNPVQSKRKKTAPDVNSVEDFPTLGQAPANPVRQASSASSEQYPVDTSHVMQRKGPELTLENKFSALQD